MPSRTQAVVLILILVSLIVMLLSTSNRTSTTSSGLYQYLPPEDVVTFEDSLYDSQETSIHQKIAIVEVVVANTDTSLYGHAMASVECYAHTNDYHFRMINDSEYADRCRHKDKFFRRHCVVAEFMKDYMDFDYVLFIDSDIGVVNPKKRIEEFIDPRVDIIFYNRFYNWEVMAGSYLAKNTKWTKDFLKGFADYEFRLPNSFHGTDNGAIHAYLAELILPSPNVDLPVCLWIYSRSKGYEDLFTYEACIRDLLGNHTQFGKIKVLPKRTAWARDNWITNSKWSYERDFMMHNWKLTQLRTHDRKPLPLVARSASEWYNPLAGPIVLSLCTRRNTTWHYDSNFVATSNEINERLLHFERGVDEQLVQTMANVRELRKRYFTRNRSS